MSFKIAGSAHYECEKCGTKYTLDTDDFEFEGTDSYERQMGPQNKYSSQHYIECEKCGNPIEIEFHVWEYPAEAYNYDDYSSSGALVVQKDFHFEYIDDEDPREDKDRLIGAAAGGAILGASLGGPVGAFVGGLAGVILGDSVNKSKKGGKNG